MSSGKTPLEVHINANGTMHHRIGIGFFAPQNVKRSGSCAIRLNEARDRMEIFVTDLLLASENAFPFAYHLGLYYSEKENDDLAKSQPFCTVGVVYSTTPRTPPPPDSFSRLTVNHVKSTTREDLLPAELFFNDNGISTGIAPGISNLFMSTEDEHGRIERSATVACSFVLTIPVRAVEWEKRARK